MMSLQSQAQGLDLAAELSALTPTDINHMDFVWIAADKNLSDTVFPRHETESQVQCIN